MGSPERPRRSAFLITWQSPPPNAPTIPGGSGQAHSTVILGKMRGRGQRRSGTWETWIAVSTSRPDETSQEVGECSVRRICSCEVKDQGLEVSKFGDLVFLPAEWAMPWSLAASVLSGGLNAAIGTVCKATAAK